MDEPANKMNIVSLLPLEMQVNIFKMLTKKEKGRCALVCKEWRDTAYMPLLWRDVTCNLTFFQKNLEKCRIICKSLVSREIKSVRMHGMIMGGVPFLNEVALLSHILVRLEINDIRMNDELLGLISRSFAKLTDLQLRKCDDVTDVGIGYLTGMGRDVAYDVPRLERLRLDGCGKITDAAFDYLSSGQPLLKDLVLFHTVQLSDARLRILSTLENLEILRLSGADRGISDVGLGHLVSLKRLRVLNFDGRHNFTVEGMLHLRKIVHLRELAIGNYYHENEDNLALLSAFPNVTTLSLNSAVIHDPGLGFLCSSHLTITKLEFHVNHFFTDEGLGSISLLKELRELILFACGKIIGPGFAHVADGNTKLVTLDVRGCYRLSSKLAVEHIVKMKELRTLFWIEHPPLTEDESAFLSTGLPLLKNGTGVFKNLKKVV